MAADGALDAGGNAVAVLAESLEETIRRRETRQHVLRGTLTLVTPAHPSSGFSIAAAMNRNKVIYALATWALVVESDAGTGGTWAGATENLRAGWVPLFVRSDPSAPQGNRDLIAEGAQPITTDDMRGDLAQWLASHVADRPLMLVREAAPESGSDDGHFGLLPPTAPRRQDE